MPNSWYSQKQESYRNWESTVAKRDWKEWKSSKYNLEDYPGGTPEANI